jgi:hypothetical protein
MRVIATQPYFEVSRKIENNVQSTNEMEHNLVLSSEKIESFTRSFGIRNVYDISYKTLSSSKGFLYLHTHQGVFSYYVKHNPSAFIEEYKKLHQKGSAD